MIGVIGSGKLTAGTWGVGLTLDNAVRRDWGIATMSGCLEIAGSRVNEVPS